MQPGAQDPFLQWQLSPQRQLGLQPHPAALEVFGVEAGAVLILISVGLSVWVVLVDMPYLTL